MEEETQKQESLTTTTTNLESLKIDGDVIRMDTDWEMKAIISYIICRYKHPTTRWVFSQAEMEDTLKISQPTMSRRIARLIKVGAVSKLTPRHIGSEFPIIPLKIHPKACKEYIKALRKMTETEYCEKLLEGSVFKLNAITNSN